MAEVFRVHRTRTLNLGSVQVENAHIRKHENGVKMVNRVVPCETLNRLIMDVRVRLGTQFHTRIHIAQAESICLRYH